MKLERNVKVKFGESQILEIKSHTPKKPISQRRNYKKKEVERCIISSAFPPGFPGGSDGKKSTYSARDLDLTPQSGRSLEEEMATHSSILAWRIPWTEEPGGIQSMESQRVRHDLVTEHACTL